MHLLIPFAAPLSDPGRQAAASLVLPQLQSLLGRLTLVQRDEADEWSLSPPHERALARALGLQGGSGRLPWAARQAQADGVDTGDLAWGLLTPAHWHLGTEQVSMIDPAQLQLDEIGSRALFDAMLPLFTGDGFLLRWGAPLRWYAAHESLAALPCASLDRVVGRNVDAWLGSDPATRRVRRLQAEVQMLLHTHSLNEQRQAQGLLAVNSFWLSGCGVAQEAACTPPQVDERLRAPALADDWAAWVKAWDTLDAGPLATLNQAAQTGQPVQLTLCGEKASATWASAPRSMLARVRGLVSRPAVWPLLESL
ncbi:MAG: hypothetical protein KA141_12810 [Rubrivivax sp.]|nr:hypothetical protein [Rubrivivax sp.]